MLLRSIKACKSNRAQSYTYATGEFTDDYDNTHYNTVSSQITGVSTTVNGTSENYTYTYNNVGYITHIYRNGSLAYSYSYDDLGQLVRENNADTNRTYVYTYDTTGNILSKKVYGYTTAETVSTTLYNTYTYTYGNTDWNDLLQGYNGVNFSHDDIGNPLSYYNGSPYTFTWVQGRRLETAQVNGYELEFTYNDEGIRTSKDVNGVTHYYHLAGSQILSEEWTENGVTHLLVYNYDADGTIMGMSYRNSTYDVQRFDNYLFVKNIQGDVLHIYDENGTKVVSYLYDAWGNITSTTGSLASTVGKMNPFRYRGYYYDEELGFYYLNSRYYDPKIGRFINADGYISTGAGLLGYNMFAYCNNNSLNYIDDSGKRCVPILSRNISGKGIETEYMKRDNSFYDYIKAVASSLTQNNVNINIQYLGIYSKSTSNISDYSSLVLDITSLLTNFSKIKAILGTTVELLSNATSSYNILGFIFQKSTKPIPDKDYYHYKATISWIDEKITIRGCQKVKYIYEMYYLWDDTKYDNPSWYLRRCVKTESYFD